jgi:peptide chain release factor 1
MRSCWSQISTTSTRRWHLGSVFSFEVLDIRPGFILFRASGKGVQEAFHGEAGGHRWQRIPPTEKKGRVQTSTITVAVLDEPEEYEIEIDKKDLEIKFTRGSGPGGQHKNKTDTVAVIKHKPSGITVRSENGKSQHDNKHTALSILRARLNASQAAASKEQRDWDRKQQLGSGQRSDKIRTIQVRNNIVVDHQTGKRMPLKPYLRGNLNLLK